MLQILLDNHFFTVISKPSGISIHNDKNSVAEWLKTQNRPLHFINRLDRETSGLVLVAQKPEFHQPLAQAMEDGQKIYRALLCGTWKLPAEKKTQWTWPLTDQAEGFSNIQGDVKAHKECLSLTELVRTNNYFSEVMIELKTGRQHQIRRHAALHGQAIAGDNRYGNEKFNSKLNKLYPQITPRLQLHAERLQFNFEQTTYTVIDPHFSLDQFF